METKLANKVTVIRTVLSFLGTTASTTITNTITAFAGVVGTVKNKLILIEGYDQIVLNGTKGITLDTKIIRKTMTNIAFKCCQATLAYANSINNNTLAAQVKYAISSLNKLTKEEIGVVCQKIQKAASTNSPAVLGFGIIATDITDLQAAINLYLAATSNPRQAIITRKNAVKQIATLISEIFATQFKGLMDIMINTLKTANLEFVGNYYAAREIIDLGTTHTKLRGNVLDPNNFPLHNVIIKMMIPGLTVISYTTKSLLNGTFEINPIRPGKYNISYELAGHITQYENDYYFKAGDEKKHKIVLIPVVVVPPVVSPVVVV